MSCIKLHWLESRSKGGYVTFGVPWKKGEVTKETVFSVNDENGNAIAYQKKPIAYYPDGTTKWTSYKRVSNNVKVPPKGATITQSKQLTFGVTVSGSFYGLGLTK